MNERSFIAELMTNKQQQILIAAESIIAREGYQGLSMQKLAEEAGVAAGTIYRYYDNKEALTAQLVERIFCQVALVILKDAEKGTVEQRFRRLWWNVVEFDARTTTNQLSYEQALHLPGANSGQHLELLLSTFQPMRQILVDGVEAGMFKDIRVEILVATSIEPAVGLARRRQQGMKFSNNELSTAYDLCWHSILK
ncbi:TetR/AcrR family transcriptional regulator [Paraferrimonas haliotis]|uniref:TetR family transcriptional regulator n=1 Tax=Paraferrimonas haliotis TaxID=2013866 RepID=A0AA37TPW3_9GAMM|nr:TetR/AcrR family transcriptional regulator [Paraferrimonas haliotis]GLS82212.1 TetR family transcriptional regulator [Paraferrimonas haliotis]